MWTNVDPVYWRIYAALGLNELKPMQAANQSEAIFENSLYGFLTWKFPKNLNPEAYHYIDLYMIRHDCRQLTMRWIDTAINRSLWLGSLTDCGVGFSHIHHYKPLTTISLRIWKPLSCHNVSWSYMFHHHRLQISKREGNVIMRPRDFETSRDVMVKRLFV